MRLSHDLIKGASAAFGLIMAIILIGYFLIPSLVFVTPGHSVYTTGVVDHKSIGYGFPNGEPQTWYTVSVRLLNEDPINNIQSGETLAYIVPKAEWEMIEWGDIVKLRLLKNLKAEIVELVPALKSPEWQEPSAVRINLISNQFIYTHGERVTFIIRLWHDPEYWARVGAEGSVPIRLTLLQPLSFWVFREGEPVFSASSTGIPQELVLQPDQEMLFNLEWDLVNDSAISVPEGVYYLRVYVGYFTEAVEHTLTGTAMLEVTA